MYSLYKYVCTSRYNGIDIVRNRNAPQSKFSQPFYSLVLCGWRFVDPRPRSASDSSVDPPNEAYVKGIKRGQICAFMSGFSFFIMETKVAVESILHFMPGMRVAIATQAEEVSVFQRYVRGNSLYILQEERAERKYYILWDVRLARRTKTFW